MSRSSSRNSPPHFGSSVSSKNNTMPYPATSPSSSAASSTSSPSHHRYPATQSTSSAFSASANPNEDWTKISDLAERRRIQNRIAQRNYRKKLKKRLEDLERRATSSASPEPHEEPEEARARPDQGYGADSSTYVADVARSQGTSPATSSQSYAPQHRPRSPSPPAAYTPYALSYPTAPEYSTYPPTSSYSPYPSLSADMSSYSSYPAAGPRTDRRHSKSETFDEQMRSFNLNYTSAPAATYEQYPQTHRPSWHEAAGPQDMHTPPLSDTDFEICPPLEIDDGLFELQQSPAEFFGFQSQQPLTPPGEEQPPFFFL